MFALLSGLTAATLHVLAGPDHLAAVTPMAIESKKRSWSVGLFWGIGHTVGALIVGVLMLMFREMIPVDEISAYSEQIVGFVLIALGAWAIYKLFKGEHMHNTQKKASGIKTALSIGMIHGLAGLSHFVATLPALGMETQMESILYISGFGVGTVVAMMAYSFVLGLISSASRKQKSPAFYKALRFSGGMASIVVGIVWIAMTF